MSTEAIRLTSLGDRMKTLEFDYRTALEPAPWAVIRVDGKAFHTWTRGLDRPFDGRMQDAMDNATKTLCEQAQGAEIGYTQSDEISVLIRPSRTGEWWLGGNVQKIASVSASIVTQQFAITFPGRQPALFDARVSTLPTDQDADDYLRWRVRDCQKNAVSALAHHRFSHKSLHGLSTGQQIERLGAEGVELIRDRPREYGGALVVRDRVTQEVTYTHKRTGAEETVTVDRRPWVIRPGGSWITFYRGGAA